MLPGITKARENRVRRIAARQGFRLFKPEARVTWHRDYGKYALYPIEGGRSVFGWSSSSDPEMNASLDDVELWLANQLAGASPSKSLENRVRRAAGRLGLRLQRLRRRDRRASDFANYQLLSETGESLLPQPATLDVIEGELSRLRPGAQVEPGEA
jgi:hypothetical protein